MPPSTHPHTPPKPSPRNYTLPIGKDDPWAQVFRKHSDRPDSPTVFVGPPGVGTNYIAVRVVYALQRHDGAQWICSDHAGACEDCCRYFSQRRDQLKKAVVSAHKVAESVTAENWDTMLGLYDPQHYGRYAQAVTDIHLLDPKRQMEVAAQLKHAEAIGDFSETTRFLTAKSLDPLHPALRRVLFDNHIAVPLPNHEEAVHHLREALTWAGLEIANDDFLGEAVEELGRSPRSIANIGSKLREIGVHEFSEDALFRYLGRTSRKGQLAKIAPDTKRALLGY